MTSKKQQEKQRIPLQIHKEPPIIPTFQNQSNIKQSNDYNMKITENIFTQDALQDKIHEYTKLFRENFMLNNQLKYILEQKNYLAEKHNQLKKVYSQQEQKRKRHRRNANQIPRNYQCPYSGCQKSYGSQGSLTQHVKIKHPDYFNSGQYQMNIQQQGNNQKINKNQNLQNS